MSFEPTKFRTYGREQLFWRGVQTDLISEVEDAAPLAQLYGMTRFGQTGTRINRKIAAIVNFYVSGFTRDQSNAILPNCIVELLQSGGNILTQVAVSDAFGAYSFANPGSGPFFVRAYKDGSPNVFGVTDRNLTAT